MTDTDTYKNAIARIYNTNNVVIGAGFLISNQYLLTCAHVVTAALGLPTETVSKPSKLIQFDFPFINREEKLNAEVDFWLPYQSYQSDPQKIGDIAGLKLHNKVIPDKVQPICLKTSHNLSNHAFSIFGFPNQRTDGVWAYGTLKDTLPNGWGQMEGTGQQGYRVQGGFSGAPIWDNEEKAVVGMAVAEDTNEQRRVAFFLPSQALFSAWPELSSLQLTVVNAEVRDFNILTDSQKQKFIEQIQSYYDNLPSLRNIFTINTEIFGVNFLARIPGDDFNTKTINLTQELMRRQLMNKFVEICRQEYPNFVKNI
ncbi:trypsin-like peptidase domain-containing protein [Anabaena sp. FACHB-1391]|uniref:S1 family peptidase n=1 Tax=Anabaena sp. FACHB-1391 TaxID=2692771 RepID=UPI001681A618|nr:serine protease [Anabaena sp. FACHB-1391]MBD2267897.1 trypsin-like peptidase domain-containing protein [Anabaena sp. FACHB-1391]